MAHVLLHARHQVAEDIGPFLRINDLGWSHDTPLNDQPFFRVLGQMARALGMKAPRRYTAFTLLDISPFPLLSFKLR
jgi:hypothetical protein